MARTPVPRMSGPEAITPVATPVNTYVRPAEPAPSSLHDLARGLSQFDAGLSTFLDKRQKEWDDADKVRAEAAFNASNHLGWAEAVRQGKVPANASPIFMKSYKEAQGNLAGIQLRDKFNREYLSWGGRSSNDPAAFDKFLGDFIKNNSGGSDDVDVLRGLNPHIQQLSSDAYSQFSQDSSKSVYDGHLSTTGALASHTIDEANKQAITEKGGVNADALFGDLMAQREQFIASGGRAEDYDAQMVEIISNKAVEHLDPKLLDLLDRKVPGSEFALKDTPAFSEKRQIALDKLTQAAISQETRMEKLQKIKDKEREDELTAGVATLVATNPMEPVPEETIKELEKYNPRIRVQVAEMRKTMLTDGTIEDPQHILELQRGIATGEVSKQDIIRESSEGRIRDASTLTSLLDRVDKYAAERGKADGVLSSSTAKRYTKAIIEGIGRASKSPIQFDLFGNASNTTSEMLEAQNDFEAMILDWSIKNPDASPMDRERAIIEAGELILGRVSKEVVKPDASGNTDAYQSQKEMDQKAYQDSKQTVPVPGSQKDPEGTSGSNETLRLQTSDKPPLLESTSEEYQKAVSEGAKDLGISEEEFNVKVWEKLKTMVTGDKPEAAPKDPGIDTNTTGSIDITKATQDADNAEVRARIGSLIDSAMEAGSTVVQSFASGDYKPVLDLLGHSEGTDRGRGYNETLGYGAYTGGDVELTKMTIGDVKQLQGKMLANPSNKWNSSAVGRYQIVRKTLVRLQKQLGISDNEVFDEKMQDRLAGALLEGRGLSDWKAGKISTEQFMNNLSQEWASLPGANGKGYYNGQRASVSVSDLASAFAALQAQPQPQVPSPAGAAPTTPTVPPNPKVYANIPQKELPQFLEWNPDPVANHENNLKSIDPSLAKVITRAQQISPVKFVIGSGKRTKDMQKKAVAWGWSKTEDSDHLDGSSADLWPLDKGGAVKFDKVAQTQIVKAMKQAAKEMGLVLDVGAEWKSFKDLPHFAIKRAKTA